ncbi:Dyp-type peroxidase [Amycolatopsis carbonis]|uniref:Dyp-type peroxidase n=1 Tax=Amycolatopsis carbonis TaxID=715471 RepID=A0A9Y2IEH9_9PSEU|nr:Dyp-type peroxidase [Amycolatopsis sp. 2-15]WIX77043.1 Dyp-type peroxidase [Amycolatopsis sp. 2-15]
MTDHDIAVPFEGVHQAGILEPAQRAAVVVAFLVTAADRPALRRMFQTLTATIRYLVDGGDAPTGRGSDDGLVSTPYENGVLGPGTVPDGLTVTVSVGASLFDDRFDLAGVKPARLRAMDEFPNDALDPEHCDGDLLLQICADHRDTVLHALRILMRATRADLQVLWQMEGFTSPPRPSGTPRNLFGFKDGTANKEILDRAELIDQLVWTKSGGDEPDWVTGGSYHVVRLIRMFVEFWDRISINEQQRIFGRDRDTGAPLSGRRERVAGPEEFQIPSYHRDAHGNTVPLTAHIRLANPHDGTADDRRMLRRGFNYSAGIERNGQLDMGMIFICFNADLDRQFVAVQTLLIDEPLVDYVSPFGGGYFFALPGVRDADDWLGRAMLD